MTTGVDPQTPEGAPPPLPLDREPPRIAAMFDAIARRYDLLNRLLSAGLDRRWRRRAVEALGLSGRERVLDLCTGTADLALALASSGHECRVTGIDFAEKMLGLGFEKIRHTRRDRQVQLLRGDAMHVPIRDAAVDAATIGFGIRNVEGPSGALREVYRVLRPGGRLAVLEFGYPRTQIIRTAYLWYFRRVLPFVGRFISHHESAYQYLPASVGTFWAPDVFCQVLETEGFVAVRAVPLTFGVVYLYEATKPADTDA